MAALFSGCSKSEVSPSDVQSGDTTITVADTSAVTFDTASENNSSAVDDISLSSNTNSSVPVPGSYVIPSNVLKAGAWNSGTAYSDFREQHSLLYDAGVTYTLSNDKVLTFSYKNQTSTFPYPVSWKSMMTAILYK